MRLLRFLTASALAVATLALPGVAAAGPVQAAAGPVQAAAGPPQTVPALRQWTAGAGTYGFTSTSRIVVDPAYTAQLSDEAATLAEDLGALAGRSVTVVTGSASPGDIGLSLGDGGLPAEGYRMTVGQSVSIQAATDTGAFYGTRTVLQLLHQSASVPAGTAVDWPAKAERGLMIDQGRKFFTVDWVKQHIKELAYLKLNYFHFHLSDTFGFRLESSTHPEIVSADHYSKQDIADLIALGQKYHVTIVPEIDTPGHMNPILAAHPELKLKNSSGAASADFIDLSLPASYALIKDLINEYLPLFPAAYWHIGADEYVTDYSKYPQLLSYARAHYGANATAKDTYYGYVNWADELVRAGGKTTRMWNDGIKAGDGTLTPNSGILVEYWYNYGLTPEQLAAAGHRVANESWTPTYYVLGGAKPDTKWMYESWTPDRFEGGNTLTDPARNPGSLIHVWCDNPTAETEGQIAAGIMYPLRALAQQTWGSPKLASTYTAFTPIAAAIGHNPAWPGLAQPGNLARNRPTTASSTETANFPASSATDGDPATRWSSAYSDPQWLQVDLGSSQAVSRVVLRWEAAYGKAFQIQLSDDNTTWRTAYSTTTGTGGVQDLTGLSGSGRYIRLYGTQRGTGYGYSLYEFEVYGGQLSGTRSLTAAGKALDDPASSSTSGTQLITWTPHGGPNQQWRLTLNADGTYTMANGSSSLCADIPAGSTAPGASVVQATCTGGDSQHWQITGLGGGEYSVANKKSGLLLTTASGSDGSLVTQQPAAGSAYQRWQIT
ncbi:MULTISPECIES: family 20 glycosylhydrolase [unclassified Streptomyces]|uniref:family 20 glycosylhydrolase n=1 Tax=unclassified Streptomyces TaxID=2593676 RepID=UPI001BE51354|nr:MULTISPECIES: family 20 glycosylhydrolase [unclassified Streptomyces]MBT2406837.1 family 20 glycosylhydrolase [Streptomyces sp. ISL-21]MBT2613526.1 family 20 glycosylhydrolase [Streptomyces sp. ISL-87]